MRKLTKRTSTKRKKTINLPTQIPKSKLSKNTPNYYHCLAETAKGKKITKACSDCKKNATALAALRKKEVEKIKTSWEQIGLSLSKLIKH